MERGKKIRPYSNLIGGSMANIIIQKPVSFGKTRSEQEENMRKEWGQTVTDEQLDKIKFLEKRAKEKVGSSKNFFTPIDADKVK
jgi:hypothetical protein